LEPLKNNGPSRLERSDATGSLAEKLLTISLNKIDEPRIMKKEVMVLKDKVLVSTIVAAIVATASFVFVNFLMKKQVDWLSAMVFLVVFAVAYYVALRLYFRKVK
jgi:hypothetical protein